MWLVQQLHILYIFLYLPYFFSHKSGVKFGKRETFSVQFFCRQCFKITLILFSIYCLGSWCIIISVSFIFICSTEMTSLLYRENDSIRSFSPTAVIKVNSIYQMMVLLLLLALLYIHCSPDCNGSCFVCIGLCSVLR